MRTINFSDARKHLKDVLDRVVDDADVTIITRRDADDVVLMSLDSIQQLARDAVPDVEPGERAAPQRIDCTVARRQGATASARDDGFRRGFRGARADGILCRQTASPEKTSAAEGTQGLTWRGASSSPITPGTTTSSGRKPIGRCSCGSMA